jgi:hypothetical protein
MLREAIRFARECCHVVTNLFVVGHQLVRFTNTTLYKTAAALRKAAEGR